MHAGSAPRSRRCPFKTNMSADPAVLSPPLPPHPAPASAAISGAGPGRPEVCRARKMATPYVTDETGERGSAVAPAFPRQRASPPPEPRSFPRTRCL